MDHFHYLDGCYHAEDVPLEQIAAEVGTPFYCYSTATLERHYNVFAGHFSGEQAKICYAMKANSNLAVLRTLSRLGAGADVVSEGEIRLAQAAGIRAQDIVFSGVGKTAQEMAYALECGIFQFNVESEPELRLLSDIAASKGMKAPVALRVNPDVDPKTHAKISTGQKESKFGVPMADAPVLYELAASLPGIDVQGVSMHIGSQLTSLTPFAQAFARLRTFVEELRGQGMTIRTLDLGGGLGIPYGDSKPPSPDEYAETALRETQGLGCQLIFEPGRMLAGNAGILVTRVIYVKKSGGRTFVIVDAAMNDLIRPALYDAYHEVVPVVIPPPIGGRSGGGHDTKNLATDALLPASPLWGEEFIVDIVGPVCETGDIFAEQRRMPLPKAGDLLAFRTAGAYGAVMASTYNARPLVAEVMVKGDRYAVVRPRQTYEALLRRDRLPEWLL